MEPSPCLSTVIPHSVEKRVTAESGRHGRVCRGSMWDKKGQGVEKLWWLQGLRFDKRASGSWSSALKNSPSGDAGSSGGERKGLCGIEARRQQHARK